jgi:hypothetical protein
MLTPTSTTVERYEIVERFPGGIRAVWEGRNLSEVAQALRSRPPAPDSAPIAISRQIVRVVETRHPLSAEEEAELSRLLQGQGG